MKSGRQGRWEGLGWHIALETEMNREVNGGEGREGGRGEQAGLAPEGREQGRRQAERTVEPGDLPKPRQSGLSGRWGGEHGPGGDLAESRLCWDPVWLGLGPGLASGPKALPPPTTGKLAQTSIMCPGTGWRLSCGDSALLTINSAGKSPPLLVIEVR